MLLREKHRRQNKVKNYSTWNTQANLYGQLQGSKTKTDFYKKLDADAVLIYTD